MSLTCSVKPQSHDRNRCVHGSVSSSLQICFEGQCRNTSFFEMEGCGKKCSGRGVGVPGAWGSARGASRGRSCGRLELSRVLTPLPCPRSRSATTTRTATASRAGPRPSATRRARGAASTVGPCPPRVSARPARGLCPPSRGRVGALGQVACCREMMSQLRHPVFCRQGNKKKRGRGGGAAEPGSLAWGSAQLLLVCPFYGEG